MSLFKARDWWSTLVQAEGGGDEECDTGCLVISNINNEDPPRDKIIVAGFSGTLRIFTPQAHRTEEGEESSGFRADHVLLETTLNYPIIQLATGKFVSGNDLEHLCVLHPDRLSVYSVSVTAGQGGQGGHGDSSRLTIAYQHKFQRHAQSFIAGPFGGVKGKDFLAVQSLDGCISVYEQESFAFSSFLPGYLLPGPLAYVAKSDSLLTISSDWSLQCYKYQAVAVATEKDDKDSGTYKSSGKRLTPEWVRQLGEGALDIQVVSPLEGPTSILILTHHAVYCYKESGVLRFVKKLEYNPSCFAAYLIDNAVNLCIATHTQTLLVYKEAELKWASQLPFVPVSLARANFPGITGGLAMLSDTGQLQVSYLGTDPSLFVAPPAETREINYEQTDKELAQLHRIIKASTNDTGMFVGMNRGEGDLMVSGSVGTHLEKWGGTTKVQDSDGVPAVPVVIRLTAHTPLNAVRVTITAEKPIAVTQDTFVLRTICDTSQIMVKFYLADHYVPTSLSVTIITSYITHSGAPKIITTNLELPLRLVAKLSPPTKEADHKVTITSNKPAVNLPELFSDYSLDGSVTTALGLQYYGGACVTILSSRTTNRYRLQSDSLPAIWVILNEVVNRLKNYWGHSSRRDGEDLVLGMASSLPINEMFSEIDAHFMRRKKHEELMNQLVQRATQFRAVQRRLLTKFKDKTPTPLTNLDNLLEGTYKQILQITDVINDNIIGLEEDGCQLSCAVRLILEFVRLSTGLSEQHYALLTAAISPIVNVHNDQGWEETTDASVTYLLKTVLGRGSKDTSTAPVMTSMADTTKLKKHLDLMLNKIMKGGVQLNLEPTPPTKDTNTRNETFSGDEEEMYTNPDHKESVEESHIEVPLGSRLGEDRARSARIRSAHGLSMAKVTQHMPYHESTSVPIEGIQDIPSQNMNDHSQDASPVNSLLFSGEGTDAEKFTEENMKEDNDEHEGEDLFYSNPILEQQTNEDNDEPVSEDPFYSTPVLEQAKEFTENPVTNQSIEALKRHTTKDNLIESPSDIFAADDADDTW